MLTRRTIGILSRESGVKITTIRYYESIGFLPVPERTSSGQRVYSSDDVRRLSFIRHARELGVPMNAIRELLSLQGQPNSPCVSVDEIAKKHLHDIRVRIEQLTALEQELNRIVQSCDGGRVEECAVIDSLSDHGACGSEHTKPVFAPLSDA